MTRPLTHPYHGARVALLTQHHKERVLGPALRECCSAEVVVVRDLDTDTLGTFTRDIPRYGTQLEAARRKAQLACELSGLPLGLGSEGSFGPGPVGFGSWDLELLVLVDPVRRLEIVGRAYEPGLHHHGVVRSREELEQVARRAGFPDHGLVLRPDGEDHPRVWKGLRTWEELEATFLEALRGSGEGRVFVENDLRAHQHPTRMEVIGRAAKELASRVASLCPECGAPGFGHLAAVPGLPCEACGLPTRVPWADDHGCGGCGHRDRRPRTGPPAADPGRCDRCNP